MQQMKMLINFLHLYCCKLNNKKCIQTPPKRKIIKGNKLVKLHAKNKQKNLTHTSNTHEKKNKKKMKIVQF